MKLVSHERYKRKISKVTDEKLFRYFKTTRNPTLKEYNKLVVEEMKIRGTQKLYSLLYEGGYIE